MRLAFICRDGTYRSQLFKEVAEKSGHEAEAYGLSEIADYYELFPYFDRLKDFNPDFILLLMELEEVKAYQEFGERREVIKVLKQRASVDGTLELNGKKVPVRRLVIKEWWSEDIIKNIAKEVIKTIEKKVEVSSQELGKIVVKHLVEDFVEKNF